MTKDSLVTATEGTPLEEAKAILSEHRNKKLPRVDGDGNLKGLITIKDIEKATKYPNSAKDRTPISWCCRWCIKIYMIVLMHLYLQRLM